MNDPFSRRQPDDPDPHPRYGQCDEYGPSGTCSLCTGKTQSPGDGIIRDLETGRPVERDDGL